MCLGEYCLLSFVLAWEAELLKEVLMSTKYPQCKCFNFSLINRKFYLFQNAPNTIPIWFWNEESDFKMFQSYLSILYWRNLLFNVSIHIHVWIWNGYWGNMPFFPQRKHTLCSLWATLSNLGRQPCLLCFNFGRIFAQRPQKKSCANCTKGLFDFWFFLIKSC